MRILVVDKTFTDDLLIEREVAAPDGEVIYHPDHEAIPEADWRSADGVITFRLPPYVDSKSAWLDKCRIIVRGGVGFDGLSLEPLGARGIAVCNVPDYGTTEVADHAIGLLLALRRGIATYHDALRADPVAGWTHLGPPCLDRLRGRRFGIIGLGRIGTAAARRAQAFDMAVSFYDPVLPDGVDLATGYTRVNSVAELFASCDAVSLHTPLNDSTRHIVDAAALAEAKEGLVLINTARGPTVDIDALYDALRDNRVAGAAIDVLPQEPPAPDHPLIKAYTERADWLAGRLILTPHAAFYSEPGVADLRRKAISTVMARLRGDGLRNCVNARYLAE